MNTTSNASTAEYVYLPTAGEVMKQRIPFYILYLGIGGLTFILCSAVFLPIVWHVGLRMRKQYVVLAGLLLSDGMVGLAYVISGLQRIPRIISGDWEIPESKFYCYIRPEHILWTTFESCSALMLMVLSLDRLVFVINPLWYLGTTYKFTLALCALAYVPAGTEFIVGFIIVYPDRDNLMVKQLCGQPMALDSNHNATIGATVSVCMYLAVLLIQRQRTAKLVGSTSGGQQQKEMQLKRQRAMTRSLALSSLVTLMTYVLPLRLITVLMKWRMSPEGCTWCAKGETVMWIVTMWNAVINPLIFVIRHPDIRIGLRAIFTGKHLPVDPDSWMSTTGTNG